MPLDSAHLPHALAIPVARWRVGLAILACSLASACNLDTSPVQPAQKTAAGTDGEPWQPGGRAGARAQPLAGATAATAANPKQPQKNETAAGSAGSAAPRAAIGGAGGSSEPAAAPAPPTAAGGAGAPAEDSTTPDGPMDAGAPAPPAPAAGQAAGASSCTPGLYSGIFTGSIQLVGLSLSSVTGTVRAQLELDTTDNDMLILHEARVQGVDQSNNEVTGQLTGKLRCSTRELQDGRLENGDYHGQNANKGTAFSGTTRARYASDPPSATGTWQAAADDLQVLSGQGTWSLVFTAPAPAKN